MIAYVSRNCGACARFLRLLSSSPKLLMATEIKIIEGNPQALLEMHELGARKTPTLVAYTKDGRRMVYEGTQAAHALIQMA